MFECFSKGAILNIWHPVAALVERLFCLNRNNISLQTKKSFFIIAQL